jgi:hypothetical protein
MKAIPVVVDGVEIFSSGSLLGKALENVDGPGAATIEVLVNVK